MRLIFNLMLISTLFSPVFCSSRQPLSYAAAPQGIYTAPKGDSKTLLDVIKSRDDLSSLAEALREPAGKFISTSTNVVYSKRRQASRQHLTLPPHGILHSLPQAIPHSTRLEHIFLHSDQLQRVDGGSEISSLTTTFPIPLSTWMTSMRRCHVYRRGHSCTSAPSRSMEQSLSTKWRV